MGLFKKDPLKEIFKEYDRRDCEDILETARAISQNDRRVASQMEFALNDPKKYLRQNANLFAERGIDFDDMKTLDRFDPENLLFLSMVNELEQFGYVFEFDYECELEDFLWGLEQIKTYDLIKDDIRAMSFDEDGNIEAWGRQINAALGGKAYLCYIDIDGDSYPLTVTKPGAFEKIPLPMVLVM